MFDDYGHHPVEIKAVLKAARDATKGRVIAIAQPHRFTRLHDLFDDFSACFNDADTVMRGAGLRGRRGADRGRHLGGAGVAHPRRRASRRALHRQARRPSRRSVRDLAKPGDFVIFLGAGNITQWAYALPQELPAARPS